jgi:hypothetical protein
MVTQIYPRRMVSSGMLRRVALVKTDVSEELSAFFIRLTRMVELGTTLAVTSNQQLLVTASYCHTILATTSVFQILRNRSKYRECSLPAGRQRCRIHTGSGDHQSSYMMDTGGGDSFHHKNVGRGVEMATEVKLC